MSNRVVSVVKKIVKVPLLYVLSLVRARVEKWQRKPGLSEVSQTAGKSESFYRHGDAGWPHGTEWM